MMFVINKIRFLQYSTLLLTLLCSQALSAENVGKIQYTRGAVTMQNMDGSSARLVAKNEVVQRGEVLKTGPRSFTIVKLNDGTRMTIRPNSSFSVEQFNAKKDSTASAVLRLFRGGMRAITGFISKHNPKAYRVKTSIATIGIRGTEFDVRLCQDDCAEENKKHTMGHNKIIDRTVARAVFVRRGLEATSIDGNKRALKAGSAIFQGDTLTTNTNAYAILIFKDKSRISLQSNTVFRVDEMSFDKDKSADSTALFSLLRGGLRTITGLIGKLNPRKYQMRTRLATIGIRGTGYDLMCTGDCIADSASHQKAAVKLPQGDGLYAHVWDGAIDFDDRTLYKGSAAFKAGQADAPVLLPTVPKFFKDNQVPRPDSFDVDESKLFNKVEVEAAPPGLYVSVSEGEIRVQGKAGMVVALQAGEAAYADVLGRRVKQLPKTPVFQQFDAYPTPDVKSPSTVNLNIRSLGGKESGMVCEIK